MVCEIMSVKEIKKNARKQKILEAAALLFSRKQYHEVMIQDVAKLASIAKGSVYNYFSSKEEIYFSIMLEQMDKLISTLDQKIKSENDSKRSLEAYILHLYMFMMKYQDFFLMYRKETLKAENELCHTISTMQSQLRNFLIDIISEGIESSVFRNIEPGFAADLILGNIYAAVDRGIEKNYNEQEMTRERSETFNFIYEGMASHPKDLPLKNKKIILTRTDEQNREAAPLFEAAGAVIYSLPMIKIVPLDNKKEFLKCLYAQPDYIVFTSANAVKIFFEKLREYTGEVEISSEAIAVGSKTADLLRSYDVNPGIIPSVHSSKGLIQYFEDKAISGKKFFIPRSAIAKDEFVDFLKQRNAIVMVMDLYNTTLPSLDETAPYAEEIFHEGADVIVFASPSAFNNFIQLTGDKGEEFLRETNIAVIGPVTGMELYHSGFEVSIQPEIFTMEALRDSIVDFYKKENK
jgi:uroporphyrinogen-III synthase